MDSPTDIIFVDPHDSILNGVTWRKDLQLPRSPSTVDAWKTTGNELFKAGRWVPAAIAYTRGLRIDPTAIVLLANRSEVYLCLKWHSGALADARRVRSDPDTPDALRHKALLREVKAEYARGNYATAHARFVEWQRFHPKGLDVAD